MSETTYGLAKQRLGPCGVHCGKCYAFAGGDICALSRQLVNSLGNFDVYARRFAELIEEPVFLKYPDFREFLNVTWPRQSAGGAGKRNASCSGHAVRFLQ